MSSGGPGSVPEPLKDKYGDDRWMSMHLRFVSEAKEAEPDILWLGDDHIMNLSNSNIWEKSFCQMHSLNFGIAGDRTESLLWRLQEGELSEAMSPKVIVLQIGTNNEDHSPEETAEGIKAVVGFIRDKQPQAYLVVLTLLPRGHKPNPLRERNRKVNDLISSILKGNSRAQLINVDPGFVNSSEENEISHRDMTDYFQLSQRGYDRAFEPVQELLQQLLAETESEVVRTEAEGCSADWNGLNFPTQNYFSAKDTAPKTSSSKR